jgi:predicted ribosomally synthesized peptide with SipW-like signal peptide
MNKKILASMMVIGLLALAFGWGTYSYFSDTAESTGNTFTTGTYDIKLWGSSWEDSVSNTYSVSNWAPGQTYKGTLYIKNAGSLKVVTMSIKPNVLTDSDTTNPLSEKMIILNFTVAKPGKVMSHMESWMEGVFGDGDGEFTLKEFYESPYWFYTGDEDGAINPGAQAWVEFVFMFDEDAGNEYQGDSCTFTLTVNAYQGPKDYTVVGDCGYG